MLLYNAMYILASVIVDLKYGSTVASKKVLARLLGQFTPMMSDTTISLTVKIEESFPREERRGDSW